MMKMNYLTGGISVVMTNQDPGVDQAESGVEHLAELEFATRGKNENSTFR
jgi:hypothetical protein